MSDEQFMRDRVREQRRHFAERNSSVPSQFALARLDNHVLDDGNRAAFAEASRVAANPTFGLGLFGKNGVGKSRLAAAIVNEHRAKAEVPAVMIGVNRLLAEVRSTYSRSSASDEEAVMKRLMSPAVLVIDDLDKLHLTSWSITMFYDLMEIREGTGYPLIVTSNRSYSACIERAKYVPADIDPITYVAALERVLEMTEDPWVEVTGRNRRMRSSK